MRARGAGPSCSRATLQAAGLLSLLRPLLALRALQDREEATVYRIDYTHEETVYRIDYTLSDFNPTMLAMKLKGGGLLIYSPGNMSAVGAALAEIGGGEEPAVVVVPSFWHNTYALGFQRAFPNAIYVASSGAIRNPSWDAETRVDYVLDARPRPGGDGFTVRLPDDGPLARALVDFDVYQFPYSNMELVLYHRPSRTLLTADTNSGSRDERFRNSQTAPAWDLLSTGFPAPQEPMHHVIIASDCPGCISARAPCGCCPENARYFFQAAEDCANWRVDPVAMLRALEFLASPALPLPGGAHGCHRGTARDEPEWRASLNNQMGYLRHYEQLAMSRACANSTGEAIARRRASRGCSWA